MKKILASAAITAIVIATLYGFMVLQAPIEGNGTIVNVESKIVTYMDNFTINITCSPGQPIKAFEFAVSFDPMLLQANNVTEGDIFDGYNTYFNSGIINNTAGTIIHIYNLIMGVGNVTGDGTFVSINFTAKSIGTSELNLTDVGVTNETQYIPITVYNGSVLIEEETIVYAMLLNYTWNLISWPTTDTIQKEDITVIYNNTVYTWQQACDNIIIVPCIYRYNGASYILTECFYPYKGYWVYSHHDGVILIYDKE